MNDKLEPSKSAVLKLASEAAGQIEDVDARAYVLEIVAEAQSRAGLYDDAWNTASSIDPSVEDWDVHGESVRDRVFATLAIFQAEAGMVEASFNTFAIVDDTDIIGASFARDRADQTSSEAFQHLFTVAIGFADASVRSSALANLFGLAFDPELLPLARQLINRVVDPDTREEAFVYLAIAQAEAGLIDEARDTAREHAPRTDQAQVDEAIDKAASYAHTLKWEREKQEREASIAAAPTTSGKQLAATAVALADEAEFARAKSAASKLANKRHRWSTLCDIAAREVLVGDYAGALGTAESIEHGTDKRLETFRLIGEALAQDGRLDLAIAELKNALGERLPEWPLDDQRAICAGLVSNGNFSAAVKATARIRNPAMRHEIIEIMASAQADTGDPFPALTIAYNLTDNYWRARILATIATRMPA